MNKTLKVITLSTMMGLFTACVPIAQPKPQIGIGIGVPISNNTQAVVEDSEYGQKPLSYPSSIRKYFTGKIARGNLSQYKFGKPKRAYKKRGFAYGGDVSWKGWLVETSIATPTRTGRLLTPKPYMFLFSGEQVVEHILGYSHKLITKVDK
jgi:hypothetical protein